ncbi:hypothetical protein C4901_02050 [Acidiferrobacter sp. SPIII_3]|nr:hypothetical protein C4901_02050 [Acidiferrobacter sp. SPIII_3]
MSAVLIYWYQDGGVGIHAEHETVWLTQEQRGQVFGRDRTVISRRIRRYSRTGTSPGKAMCKKCTLLLPPIGRPRRFRQCK